MSPLPREGYVQTTDDAAKQQELDHLLEEHRALNARLHELDKHISLTSAERVERAELKKMKLRTKERILILQRP